MSGRRFLKDGTQLGERPSETRMAAAAPYVCTILLDVPRRAGGSPAAGAMEESAPGSGACALDARRSRERSIGEHSWNRRDGLLVHGGHDAHDQRGDGYRAEREVWRTGGDGTSSGWSRPVCVCDASAHLAVR